MNKPFTLLAEVHRDLLGDALGDVHLSAQAGHTHIGGVGRDGGATGAAQAEEEIGFWSTERPESRARIMQLLKNDCMLNNNKRVLRNVYSSDILSNLQDIFAQFSTYMLPWLLVAGDCMYSISVNLTGH